MQNSIRLSKFIVCNLDASDHPLLFRDNSEHFSSLFILVRQDGQKFYFSAAVPGALDFILIGSSKDISLARAKKISLVILLEITLPENCKSQEKQPRIVDPESLGFPDSTNSQRNRGKWKIVSDPTSEEVRQVLQKQFLRYKDLDLENDIAEAVSAEIRNNQETFAPRNVMPWWSRVKFVTRVHGIAIGSVLAIPTFFFAYGFVRTRLDGNLDSNVQYIGLDPRALPEIGVFLGGIGLPPLKWSSGMFRKTEETHGEQATEAGRDCHEVTAG